MSDTSVFQATRRAFIGALSAGGISAALHAQTAKAATVATKARIVIVGAGAAGSALANRLVTRLDGASITVIDARPEHFYQPGLSLVAAGLKPPSYVVSRTTDWLPRGISLIAEAAAAIDPVGKTVATTGGKRVPYDFLLVATGLVLDHAAIEGFSLDLVGKNGIGALYAGPD